jgi:cell division protein FtsZ
MTEMGKAMMGTGEASGEGRALMAAENAIQNPLLDEVTLKGAKAVLVNITGGLDMTLLEVDEAANAISNQVDPEANIIFGAAFDASLQGVVRVSVVATGMDGASMAAIETYEEPRGRGLRVARHLEAVPVPTAPEPASVHAMHEDDDCALPPAFKPLAAEAPAPVVANEGGLLFDAPVAARPATPQPVAKIVDPSVADSEDEPLFSPPLYNGDDRRQKSGFLSLFGGSRKPARGRPPAGRAGGGAQAAVEQVEDAETDTTEELEIPSFLRRLAN